MQFNRLRESWRTSPESWHLSCEYITSDIWRTSPESWHLSREYITSVQYIYMVRPKRHSRPGKVPTTAPQHTKGLSPGVWLARGNHPHPPHRRSSVPAAHRVSAIFPRTGLASGKLPTRLLSLPCAPTGFYFLIPK